MAETVLGEPLARRRGPRGMEENCCWGSCVPPAVVWTDLTTVGVVCVTEWLGVSSCFNVVDISDTP